MEDIYGHMTDEEVVRMALQDASFFEYIVTRYEDKLSRYLIRLGVRNKEDREDVLQEVFLKVYKNLNDFDNEAISAFRKRHVRPEGHLVDVDDEHLTGLVSTEETPADLFAKSVNSEVVNRALLELPEKYRDVIVLRFFEHKEYEEISDILKIPVSTVGTLIHRGKRTLETLIDSEAIHI
jgi:RNA polymerase sigma-70 factor, ECF subfamily